MLHIKSSHITILNEYKLSMLKLSNSKQGKNYKIHKIDEKENIKARLLILGILKGTEIYVFNKKKNGDVVIKVRGIKYGIDEEISKNIFIQ